MEQTAGRSFGAPSLSAKVKRMQHAEFDWGKKLPNTSLSMHRAIPEAIFSVAELN
jgi:hypothetical protein